jgi:hypothetical protein
MVAMIVMLLTVVVVVVATAVRRSGLVHGHAARLFPSVAVQMTAAAVAAAVVVVAPGAIALVKRGVLPGVAFPTLATTRESQEVMTTMKVMRLHHTQNPLPHQPRSQWGSKSNAHRWGLPAGRK